MVRKARPVDETYKKALIKAMRLNIHTLIELTTFDVETGFMEMGITKRS
jgi:hypothetical protein